MSYLRLSLVVLPIALSGCSLIRLNGKPLGGSSEPSESSRPPQNVSEQPPEAAQEAGAQAVEPPAGPSDGERVLAAYQSFDLSTCPRHGSCASTFAKSAGLKQHSDRSGYVVIYNPRSELPNPDPTWLVGWDQLPSSERANKAMTVYGAMVQALKNRHWLQQCKAEYSKRHAKFVDQDAKFAADIAAARKLPLHARFRALLQLRGKVDVQYRHSGVDGDTEFSYYVGRRYALEVALVEEFGAAGLERIYGKIAPERKFRSLLRPRLEVERETQLFCAAAAHDRIDGLPRTDLEERGVVRPALAKSELAEATKTEQAERAAAAKLLVVPATSDEQVIDGLDMAVQAKDTEGRLALGGTPPVTKVERRGDKLIITTSEQQDEQEIVGCKQTRDRVVLTSQGAKYDKSCRYRTRRTVTQITLTISGMPKEVDIKPGDRLRVLGRIGKVTDKTKRGKQTRRQLTTTMEVEYLLNVRRGSKLVEDFLPIAP